MSVRYIHTQEQARAELELQAARKKVSDARRKERMQNDPEYRDKLLQSRKTKRQQKRKALEEDPLHADARNDADRMARARRVARDTQEVQDAQEREERKFVRGISHTISYI